MISLPSYVTRIACPFPLANGLVFACRDAGTLADLTAFASPPSFPHHRASHDAYWEPLGDQLKPLFVRFLFQGKEMRFGLPESRVWPHGLESCVTWARLGSFHPGGLKLDSVCFCPAGIPGYLNVIRITNSEDAPVSFDVIVGGSYQTPQTRTALDGCLALGFPEYAAAYGSNLIPFTTAEFEDLRQQGVSVSDDARAGSGLAYFLGRRSLRLEAGETSVIVIGGLLAQTSPKEAVCRLQSTIEVHESLLAETSRAWQDALADTPSLECSDARVRDLWDWAWVNLQLLNRENANCPWLPGVEYTTLPSLPMIYCWDHLYTTLVQVLWKPEWVRNVLLEFFRNQWAGGFVPGEIAPDGKAGHLFSQCHALLVYALEHYLTMTGDLSLLAEDVKGKTVYERAFLAMDWYRREAEYLSSYVEGRHSGVFEVREGVFRDEVDGLIWTPGMGDTGWDTASYRGYDNEWVDMNVYLYQGLRAMVGICRRKGDVQKGEEFDAWAEQVKASINCLMWDQETRFYYDLDQDHRRLNAVTAGGLLPLLSDISSRAQEAGILEKLTDEGHFWRPFGVPCLSVSHPRYDPRGYYWLGSCPPHIETTLVLALYERGHTNLGWRLWEKILAAHAKSYGGPRYFYEAFNADTGEGQWAGNYNWTTAFILPLVHAIAGLRIEAGQPALCPRLPREWDSLHISGLRMLGKSWQIRIDGENAELCEC